MTQTLSTTFFSRHPLTPRASNILTSEDELVISPVSINEAVYVSFRKLAREKHGISNIYDVKRFLKTSDGPKLIETAFSMVLGLIEDAGINIVPTKNNKGSCLDVRPSTKRCNDSRHLQKTRDSEGRGQVRKERGRYPRNVRIWNARGSGVPLRHHLENSFILSTSPLWISLRSLAV